MKWDGIVVVSCLDLWTYPKINNHKVVSTIQEVDYKSLNLFTLVATSMRKQKSQGTIMKVLEGIMKIVKGWIFWRFKGDYNWMNGMNFNGKNGQNFFANKIICCQLYWKTD